MAERKFAIRLSLADQEKVKAALKSLGPAGAEGLKAFSGASDKAGGAVKGLRAEVTKTTPDMRAMSSVAGDARQQFDGFASRIPVVGGALKALGPAGLAAAAGIGAAVAGLGAAVAGARGAMQEFSRIGTAANALSITREELQGIEAIALENGVAGGELAGMLMTLNNNASSLAFGMGKLGKALGAVNPELVDQIKNAQTTAQRWDVLAEAVRGAATETERQQIVTAAFGTTGLKLLQVLRDQGSATADLVKKGKELGLVIDEDMIKKAHAADDRFNVLTRSIDLQLKSAFVDLAPVIVGVAEALAHVARNTAGVVDGFRDVEDATSGELKRRLNRLVTEREAIEAQLAEAEAGDGMVIRVVGSEAIVRTTEDLRRMRDELNASAIEIDRLLAGNSDADRAAQNVAATEAIIDKWSAIIAASKTPVDKARDALAEFNAELTQHGDISGEAAQVQAILTKAVKDAEAAAWKASDAYKRQQEAVKAAADQQKSWQTIVDSGQTAVERLEAQLASLRAEHAANAEAAQLQAAAEAVLRGQIDAAKDAAAAATPEFKAVAEARATIAKAYAEALSPAEKLAAEEGRLNALIGQNGFTAAEAGKALEAYRKGLEKTKDDTIKLRLANELLESALAGQINSWEDLGKVAARVIAKMLIDAAKAKSELAGGSGGSGGFLQFAASVVSSAFGFGAAPAAAGSGAASVASAGARGPGNSLARVKVAHSGYAPGDMALPTRSVPKATFINAPRFHEGYDPSFEMPAIVRRDERIFSPGHNERIVRAIEGGQSSGAGAVTVNVINNAGAEVETRETRGPAGDRQVDVMISRKINKHIADGGADKAMNARFALKPQGR